MNAPKLTQRHKETDVVFQDYDLRRWRRCLPSVPLESPEYSVSESSESDRRRPRCPCSPTRVCLNSCINPSIPIGTKCPPGCKYPVLAPSGANCLSLLPRTKCSI